MSFIIQRDRVATVNRERWRKRDFVERRGPGRTFFTENWQNAEMFITEQAAWDAMMSLRGVWTSKCKVVEVSA